MIDPYIAADMVEESLAIDVSTQNEEVWKALVYVWKEPNQKLE